MLFVTRLYMCIYFLFLLIINIVVSLNIVCCSVQPALVVRFSTGEILVPGESTIIKFILLQQKFALLQ